MIFKEILFEEIDIDNEAFRITEILDSEPLLDSLRAIGQLNPVLLMDRSPRKVIVCGFRRIRAMKRLGKSQVLARIISEEGPKPSEVFGLALWDNLSHRQLGPLEKARALLVLRQTCGLTDDVLIKTYLPLLGLASHEGVLRAYLALNNVRPGLRHCLTEGQLTHSSIEYLAEMPSQVQDSIAALMTSIRLSASLQRKVLALLEDLSAIAEAQLDAPLAHPGVLAVLDDSRLSPYQKGEKLHEVLYRLRNPRLSQATDRFLAQKRKLGLPGSIQITSNPFFETADLRVEFSASSVERVREQAALLHKAAQLPELEGMFQLDPQNGDGQ